MSAHVFKVSGSPVRDDDRWRCTRCGVKRRRVVAMPSRTAALVLPYALMKVRSFWLYRFGVGAWTNQQPGCTGLRA